MTRRERFAHFASLMGRSETHHYSEAPGTRLVGHLRPGDEVLCKTAQGEEWREVSDAIRTGGFVVVYFADGNTAQLDEGLVVKCRPRVVQIDSRNLRDLLGK
jgi:hypothetical protein